MNRAMYAAASGMAAQQQNIDVIANNLANADVAGFKGAQLSFASLGERALLGTKATGVTHAFDQGKLMKTGGPFDVAIDGPGFFAVERDGERGFTRAGSFSRAADGALRNADGWQLRGVRIPANAATVASIPTAPCTSTERLSPGASSSCASMRRSTCARSDRLCSPPARPPEFRTRRLRAANVNRRLRSGCSSGRTSRSSKR